MKSTALSVRLTVLAILTAGCASRAPARSFPELQERVRPGQTVYVIDSKGHETRGSVAGVSDSTLRLNIDNTTRAFNREEVRQVQRYGDSLWNGALIGAAIALPPTLISDAPYAPCDSNPATLCRQSKWPYQLSSIALFGGIGAGVDALMRSRQQVYLATFPAESKVNVRPVLQPSSIGVLVTIDVRSGAARRPHSPPPLPR